MISVSDKAPNQASWLLRSVTHPAEYLPRSDEVAGVSNCPLQEDNNRVSFLNTSSSEERDTRLVVCKPEGKCSSVRGGMWLSYHRKTHSDTHINMDNGPYA